MCCRYSPRLRSCRRLFWRPAPPGASAYRLALGGCRFGGRGARSYTTYCALALRDVFRARRLLLSRPGIRPRAAGCLDAGGRCFSGGLVASVGLRRPGCLLVRARAVADYLYCAVLVAAPTGFVGWRLGGY
ncbi:unnamed protein product [Amoebophrya sp. A120]|nr:unnamed protein product [Amoebophrya sp. A120]|eukprot:GSA120T00008939001.1